MTIPGSAKRLGIVPHVFAQPLIQGLKFPGNSAAAGRFDYEEGEYAQLAHQLRQGKLDGAFLSPVEYIRLNDPFDQKEHVHAKIVPNVAVTSEGESGAAILVFKEYLRNVNTIAVDPRFPSEIVLLQLVMAEKYDTRPKFIPVMPGTSGTPGTPGSIVVDISLAKADAALVVDRDALLTAEHRSRIDLVDEWFDLTELPFVHGVWVVREDALSIEEINALATGAQPVEILKDVTTGEKEYLSNFNYTLDDDAMASLNEFFRMAYYHGVVKDIPDVRVYPLE